MRTNDENKMYKLYESANRKKQMIGYIVESAERNPWLFKEAGPVLNTPTNNTDIGAVEPDKAQKLEELKTMLMDFTAEELIELMQKVVVAQQEAAAAANVPADLTTGEASTQSPDLAEVPPPPTV